MKEIISFAANHSWLIRNRQKNPKTNQPKATGTAAIPSSASPIHTRPFYLPALSSTRRWRVGGFDLSITALPFSPYSIDLLCSAVWISALPWSSPWRCQEIFAPSPRALPYLPSSLVLVSEVLFLMLTSFTLYTSMQLCPSLNSLLQIISDSEVFISPTALHSQQINKITEEHSPFILIC